VGNGNETRRACPKCKGEVWYYSEGFTNWVCVNCHEYMVPTEFAKGEGTGPRQGTPTAPGGRNTLLG
jgi:hypothetical protein